MLEELFARASIKIYDYGIHRRREMSSTGRVFPFYVMSYLSRGHAVLRVPGREIELSPRSVIMIPPGVPHDHVMARAEESVFWWWHFDYKVYDAVDLLALFRLPLVHTVEDNDRFEALFRQYNDAIDLPDSIPNTLFRMASTLEVLGNLLEELMGDDAREGISPVPKVFLDILSDVVSCVGKPLELSSLASKYSMHPTYISNRFTSYFGVSPIRLHHRLMMENAKELLKRREKTVGEAAEMLGYSDVSSFSRAFKTAWGVSPAAVRAGDAPLQSVRIDL